MSEHSHDSVWRQLESYYQTSDPAPLTRALCQLMAEYATEQGESRQMAQLVTIFLSREIRYHRQVERLRDREELRAADLKSLAGKRSIALQDMIEQTKQTPAQTSKSEIARQLLLAECYYQVQEPDKVVAHLENALADGAEEPVVYFALGYNRYRLALESFEPVVEIIDSGPRSDLLSFQRNCLQAVSAFENALTGHSSDSEVYEWIGRVLETAGFEEAAHEAFDKADDLAYSDDGLGSPGPAGASVSRSPTEQAAHREPITKEEIEQFGRQLEGSHDIAELSPDDGDLRN